MIRRGSTFEVKRIPISQITIYECQERYPERVLHYVELMRKYPEMDCGFIIVSPDGNGRFLCDDGHHRYCAAILTGRKDLLAIVVTEPETADRGAL